MTGGAIRRKVLVSGTVQGVFFRESLRREAERVGAAGGATNLPDGRVEVVLEGQPDAVEELVRWCHEGPAHARVESVEVQEESPRGVRGFSTD